MSTLKGAFKIVTKEMGLTFYINLALTIGLFALYCLLSFRVEGSEYLGVIFGPFYVVFLAYPFILFKSYKYILALGGTRNHFLISTLLASFMYLFITVTVLNGLHLIGDMIFQDGYIFHMADLVNDTNTAMYFWVDFLWLSILFGIGMFVQVINFNLGTLRTLSGGAVLILTSVALFFFIDLTPLFEFIITDYALFVHLLALGALILLVLSYFMMRNAPLERGDRKIFNTAMIN